MSSILLGNLTLVSCADRPTPYPDFCEKLGRQLTAQERYSRAILYAYDDAEQLHLVHFDSFRRQYLNNVPGAVPQTVVNSYLKANPDCCVAVQPWPVRNYDRHKDLFGRNATAERQYEDVSKTFRWTHDVLVGVNGRANPAVPVANVEFQESDCGEVSRQGRG